MLTADAQIRLDEMRDAAQNLAESRALLRAAGAELELPAAPPAEEAVTLHVAEMERRQPGVCRAYGDTGVREWARIVLAGAERERAWCEWRVVTIRTPAQAREAVARGATIRDDGRAILPRTEDARVVARLVPLTRVGSVSYIRMDG